MPSGVAGVEDEQFRHGILHRKPTEKHGMGKGRLCGDVTGTAGGSLLEAARIVLKMWPIASLLYFVVRLDPHDLEETRGIRNVQ